MNKYRPHIFFLLLFFFSTMAHGKETRGVVKAAGGEELLEKAREFIEINTEEAEAYSLQALDLGIKENDELLTYIAYCQLTSINFNYGQKEKAIEYAQLAETGFKKLNNLFYLAELYSIWSYGLFDVGDKKLSDYYSDKSIEFSRQSNNYNILIRQLHNRGARAYFNGENFLALNYMNEVLAITEQHSDLEIFKARSYNLLGNIYIGMTDTVQSKKYYKESISVFENLGITGQFTLSYSNLSLLYLPDMPDSAYYFVQKAQQAQYESKIEYHLSSIYHALFNYYSAIENKDSASYYINKSIEVGEKFNRTTSVAIYHGDAGRFYFQINDFDRAMYHYKTAKQLSKKLEIPEITIESLKHIGIIYYSKNQTDSAAYYYNEFVRNDTLKTINKIQQDVLKLSELRIHEQTEYKLKEAKSKRQILIYFLAGSLILIISLSLLLRKIAKQRNRINQINKKLNENQKELNSLVGYKTKQLYDKEKQYTNLCDNMFNGAVFRMNADSFEPFELKFSFVSSGWEAMTGLPVHNLGKMMPEFEQCIAGKDKESLFNAIQNAFVTGSIVDKIFPFNKDGETIWLHIRAVLTSVPGETASLDGYVVDETEQKLSEEKLIAAKEKAEESDRLKTAFLANISHEIRTPMNVISGFSNLIVNNQVPEEEKDNFLKTINDNCFQLLQIINDIIEISQIDSGQLKFSFKEVTVNDIIKKVDVEVISLYKERYPDLEIGMSENLETIASTIIKTDITKLTLIIDYLIDNGVKFTPQKGFVEFGAIPDNDNLHFYVKDTGVGIAPENLDKIFDNFTKINPNAKSGTGLGLAIVRKLLAKLGGKIWVESEINVGSVFHFTIPKR